MAAKAPSSSSSLSRSNVCHQQGHSDEEDKALTESDLAAAQQLMQLSDEDNNSSSTSCASKRRRRTTSTYKGAEEEEEEEEEGVEYESPLSDITWAAKIEEIFGKEEDFMIIRPKKKTRFRSLAHIYLTTKPIRT